MYSGTPTQVTKPWTMYAVDGGIQIQTISNAGYQEDDPAIQHARAAGFEVDDAGWLCHQGHRIRCRVEGQPTQDPTEGYGPPPWAPWEI